MLTKEMVGIIQTHTVGCLATLRPDGVPAVSPKGTFLVLDERTIAFANIRSQRSVDNLRSCADVEVAFVDVFHRRGCRIRGFGTYVPNDQTEPSLQARFERNWPNLHPLMRGIAVISVTAAEIVTSPSYDVGAVPRELAEHWLRHHAAMLGFTVSRLADASPSEPIEGR